LQKGSEGNAKLRPLELQHAGLLPASFADYNKSKMKVERISELTTNRLSVYLRCLKDLAAQGVKSISSEGLAEKFHLNSAQIRKDLAYFGAFGVRGVGYYVEDLKAHLVRILGLDREHNVAIIGAGRLGSALADYYRFAQSNFSVVALFDSDEDKIGRSSGGVRIYSLRDFAEVAKEKEIDVAVITVPASSAQEVLNCVLESGIKAILNFAPSPMKTNENVKVKTVDLTISLESLSYFLAQTHSVNGSK
jgi:redox-sensing transcriptional repressor